MMKHLFIICILLFGSFVLLDSANGEEGGSSIEIKVAVHHQSKYSFTTEEPFYDALYGYSWTVGDITYYFTPTYTYTEDGTYTVTLTVNDGTDDGTTTGTVEVNVTAAPVGPTAGFTYLPATVVNGTQVNFTDASTAGDVNISTYFWDFGDGTNSSLQHPTHTYTATGDVTVKLTVTDEGALTDESEQTVTVTEVAAD